MGLFSKKDKQPEKSAANAQAPKEEKLFDKSVMLYFMLFSDLNPELAVEVNRDRAGMQMALAKKYIIEIVKKHYFEELRPPVVWNFNSFVDVIPNLHPSALERVRFWDPETHEMVDRSNYLDVCSGVRSRWKEGLAETFPDYDREKLEDGFEHTYFEYYPEDGMIVLTVLLEKLLPLM